MRVALPAALSAGLIQIGTNFANDYFDFVKGADTEERVGQPRATQQGWITPQTMAVSPPDFPRCLYHWVDFGVGWRSDLTIRSYLHCMRRLVHRRTLCLAYIGLGDPFSSSPDQSPFAQPIICNLVGLLGHGYRFPSASL